jgi:hypothetical protein
MNNNQTLVTMDFYSQRKAKQYSFTVMDAYNYFTNRRASVDSGDVSVKELCVEYANKFNKRPSLITAGKNYNLPTDKDIAEWEAEVAVWEAEIAELEAECLPREALAIQHGNESTPGTVVDAEPEPVVDWEAPLSAISDRLLNGSSFDLSGGDTNTYYPPSRTIAEELGYAGKAIGTACRSTAEVAVGVTYLGCWAAACVAFPPLGFLVLANAISRK